MNNNILKNKHIGKCAICGNTTILTYEHIPPYKAFNNNAAKVISGDSLIKLISSESRKLSDTNGLKYEQQQRGMGKYSLCKQCNNITGSYYASYYCDFTNFVMYYIINDFDKYMVSDKLGINGIKFKPLNFIKQILAMFCSTTQGLTNEYKIIKDTVLEKNNNLINPDFKLRMAFVKNQKISYSGCVTMLMGEINNLKSKTFSEIIAFPYAFIFEYDKNFPDNKTVDITNFLSYKYDEEIELRMEFPIVERGMALPLDYRIKEEL